MRAVEVGRVSKKNEGPLMGGLTDRLFERFRLWRAESLLARGRFVSASRYLARISTSHVRAWRLKGRLFVSAGLPVAAVQCFREAVRARGATLEDILELSFGLVAVRDYEGAQSVLGKYLSRVPDDPRAQRLLAHIFRAQGRLKTAMETLQAFRPKRVAAKYANLMPPAPKLAWRPEKAWAEALAQDGRTESDWQDPASMAMDKDGRDRLLCYFDELRHRKGGKKALAYAVGLAIESGESWLLPWVRHAAPYLKLDMPKGLPSFLARYGNESDKHILLAGLSAGREERSQSAIALISLGFLEFEEVLDEARSDSRESGNEAARIPQPNRAALRQVKRA